jgi:hypothetical protein
LNRHYQPIHVHQRAAGDFPAVSRGRARHRPEFKTFDFESWASSASRSTAHDFIRTVNRAIRVPRVIVLQLYDRIPKTKVRFSRHNIYMRDGNMCQYCGRELPRAERTWTMSFRAPGRAHHLGERRLLLRRLQPVEGAPARPSRPGH